MLSKEQIKRVIQSIKETEKQIDKEMKYKDELRNTEMLAFYNEHLKKLKGML